MFVVAVVLCIFLHAITLVGWHLLLRIAGRHGAIALGVLLGHHSNWTGGDHELWLGYDHWLVFSLFAFLLSQGIICFQFINFRRELTDGLNVMNEKWKSEIVS